MNEVYKLFAGSTFYPSGGYEDFKGDFSSIEIARIFIEKEFQEDNFMWAHVVLNDEIVLTGYLNSELTKDEYIKKWKWEYNED